MSRMHLLFLAGLVLCGVMAVFGQATRSPVLTPTLRTHLQSEQFQIVTSIRGLPLGVRDRLQALFGNGTLDIADPGGVFQGTTDRVSLTVPARRLVTAGCASDNHCLMYYEKGGAKLTHFAVLVSWSPIETKFEFGGTAPAGLKTIDDVLKALLTGAIKPASGPW